MKDWLDWLLCLTLFAALGAGAELARTVVAWLVPG